MKINLKKGIDEVLFGMYRKDVVEIYGLPDKQLFDEEDNELYFYNKKKLTLSFYKDEDYKLCYIFCSNQDLRLFDKTIIGKNIDSLKKELATNGIKKLEFEDFETFEHYYDEDNWIFFATEYNEVVKVELGAVIINDEFVFEF